MLNTWKHAHPSLQQITAEIIHANTLLSKIYRNRQVELHSAIGMNWILSLQKSLNFTPI
jgi:hypothetical protein